MRIFFEQVNNKKSKIICDVIADEKQHVIRWSTSTVSHRYLSDHFPWSLNYTQIKDLCRWKYTTVSVFWVKPNLFVEIQRKIFRDLLIYLILMSHCSQETSSSIRFLPRIRSSQYRDFDYIIQLDLFWWIDEMEFFFFGNWCWIENIRTVFEEPDSNDGTSVMT